jgi:hypothetical protein
MDLPVAVTERRSVKPIAIGKIAGLQSLLIRCSLVNLFIVALIGVLLRSFQYAERY